jgi:HEPN domain-containing protein
MTEFAPTVESIESYVDYLRTSKDLGASNVASLKQLDGEQYKEARERVEYWHYLQSADYHYFISRLLFLHHITEYSFFSGHQAIENYLKAYLKWKKELPPNSHNLSMLLQKCRACAPETDAFIHEDRAPIILAKYEPFYELARYPVQKRRPKGGYAFLIPDDVYVLDYFVLRMRRILSIPDNTWDILKDGHYALYDCQRLFPDFYGLFFANNINFDNPAEWTESIG